MQYYADIELMGSEIINCKIEAVSALPTFTSSDASRVVYNLADNSLYYNNGSAWVALQAASSTSDPLIETLGENWINSDYSFNPTPFNDLYGITGLTADSTLFDVIDQLDTAIDSAFYPQTAAEAAAGVTPTNYAYAPGTVDRYGTNTTPGTTDMTTALINALACSAVVTALPATYNFATTTGFTLKGKRIIGAGSNATIFQVPNIAANNNAFSIQSISGSYDSSAPGLSGLQILGNGNANAGANGVALISSDSGGCHGGVFSDVLVCGFQGAGSSGWLLSASNDNGIYDNLFINCFGGPSGGGDALLNTVAWTTTTTDAPVQPNRCNNNTWYGGGAFFSTGDGVYMDYASANTFIGFDREGNGGWGFNVQGICSGVTIVGGDSESNTAGSVNKSNSSSDIHVFGGNVNEAAAGEWNAYDHYFPGGTQAGKCGVDNSGNVTMAGTLLNITGENPTIALSGTNVVSFNTSNNGVSVRAGFSMNNVNPYSQVTGWGTPTDPGVIENFPGANATLQQCSEAIAQIIKDLKGLGLYAA